MFDGLWRSHRHHQVRVRAIALSLSQNQILSVMSLAKQVRSMRGLKSSPYMMLEEIGFVDTDDQNKVIMKGDPENPFSKANALRLVDKDTGDMEYVICRVGKRYDFPEAKSWVLRYYEAKEDFDEVIDGEKIVIKKGARTLFAEPVV